MGAQLLSTQAVVLHRTASGDNWLRLQAFSVAAGQLDCLQRRSSRSAAVAPMLDLFDEAALTLETRNEGRTWFVKEVDFIKRRAGLGRSYDSLQFACRFAALIRDNPVPEDGRSAVYALLERALDAWETRSRPDVVYFKSIYCLARDEGYPVAQEWRSRIAPDERACVAAILRERAATQSAEPAAVANLTRDLEHYLRHHTEIRVGD